MAIDIYEGSKLSLSMSVRNFERLGSALSELVRRTGRTVDPYGTSNLSPEHTGIWLGSLRELLPHLKDARTRAECQTLIDLLNGAQKRGATLVIEGE